MCKNLRKMRKYMYLSLLLSLFCSSLFCCRAVNSSNTERGNTASNIANLGLVSKQGDWIYYSNVNMDRKLYKMRIDGTAAA